MRRKLKVREMMAHRPCAEYTEERVRELWSGRPALTPREVGELPIPAEDRIWCLLTCFDLSDRATMLFAAHCAADALHSERAAGRDPDRRSWDAVTVAYNFATGRATDAQRDAAWDAAGSSARADALADARDAAWAAAWAAACAAARDAARDAAWGAARDAALAAAGAAAGAAVRNRQCALLVEYAEWDLAVSS
jgi:hypothetical protein